METDIEEKMKRMEEQYEKERQIICPYCDTIQSNDDLDYPVTYHGEPSISEFYCQECEKTFFVREFVSRTYESAKTNDELF